MELEESMDPCYQLIHLSVGKVGHPYQQHQHGQQQGKHQEWH